MNLPAIFGINVLMSLTSSIVAAALFAWPWLRVVNGKQALLWLVALAGIARSHLRAFGADWVLKVAVRE